MTVRVGVIGVGSIGRRSARTLARRIAGSTVTAVYDANHPAPRRSPRSLGATATESAEALIHDDRVDAVVIASPDACMPLRHWPASRRANALREAARAAELDDALAVVAAEVTLGRRLVTLGFMRRFDPGYAGSQGTARPGEGAAAGPLHPSQPAGGARPHERDVTDQLRRARDRCQQMAARRGVRVRAGHRRTDDAARRGRAAGPAAGRPAHV